MQTEGTDQGVELQQLDEVVEVEDSLHDDIADAYDELALKEESVEPEVEVKPETSLDDDVAEAVKELQSKPEQVEAKPQATKTTTEEVEIKAPARFTAEEKEVFNKLPKELKATAKKAFDDMQADYTRAKQFLSNYEKELQQERSVNSELTRVAQRFIASKGAEGISPEQAVIAMFSAHERLTNPDKEQRKIAYAEMLLSSGLEPADFADILGGQVQTQQRPVENYQPQLTEQEKQRQLYLDSLIARDQQAKLAQEQNLVQTAIAEIEQVREMKDSSGRYMYPKLHEMSFMEQVKPLVSAIMRTTGDSWGEAVKKAYHTLIPDSLIGQTRLHSENNKNGATIVRTSPTVRNSGQPSAFPEWGKEDDGLSLEDDIRASLELLKRGGSGTY